MSGPKVTYVKQAKPKLHIPSIAIPKIIRWPNEINFDMENIFSNMNLFKIMIKWRLHLIIIMATAIGLSILFSCSWFIKPQFKSTAVLYPSNLIPYSSETPTELMLQIFRSDDIRDSLIAEFKLASHYDVDKNDKYYYTSVIKEFESNVDVRKTEYESVVIDILDTDPEMACKMVKEMVNLFNKKARGMQRDKSMEILKINKTQLEQKQIQIDSLGKKLDTLRVKYGILDYKVQTKEASKAYYKMLGGTVKGNMNSVTGTIENLRTKGGDFILLNDLFNASTTAYNKLKEDYENALKDVTKELTYTNYVSSPVAADKKTYPIRWLIIVITTLTTFIFSMIVIMLLENAKKKEEEKISKAEGA